MTKTTRLEKISKKLFSIPKTSVYVVLDGAAVKDLLINLDTYEPVSFCLYQGPLPQDVEEAAPYLVYLEKGCPFTNWVLENGWGKHWGIFAVSREKPKAMRRHFRSLVMIKNSQGERLFFRYYDPRVLHPYLTTCNESELKRVFGPVIHFITEHDNSDTLLRFSRTDSKELEVTSSRLDDKGAWDKPHPRQKIIMPEESFNNLEYETYTLVVRDEQVKVLLQRKRQIFIRRLAEHLETNHSQLLCEKKLKDESLTIFIQTGIDKADNYGITGNLDVTAFVECMLELGRDFDQDPLYDWAQKILNRKTLNGTQKMNFINEHLINRNL